MKTKILALLTMLFLIYQGYTFWLQKLNRKNRK
jgi:hypothetical protein